MADRTGEKWKVERKKGPRQGRSEKVKGKARQKQKGREEKVRGRSLPSVSQDTQNLAAVAQSDSLSVSSGSAVVDTRHLD